ncbi:MAG: helix-turn-helix transcriptional regulator [Ruminococcaceae bacterium]|nr:helix-turn-helix transcriptional regulator [Oscillospiraceae bacterium]
MDIILPEIVSLGIYNSQFAKRNKPVTKNRKTTMFEIEIPIEKGGVSFINSDQMAIAPNMIICAKPGQMRHTRFPFKCYYIHMIINKGFLYDSLMDVPNYIKTEKYDKYLSIFERMCKYYETSLDNDEIFLHSLILELIYTLVSESEKIIFRENIKSNNYRTLEKAMNYIKNNITSNLSLENVSSHAGFSPIHFHNMFKASTGQTLREYVEDIRIKKAVNMLVTTDYTLTKIAYECGFSSQSYFSYAFKRKMKTAPREYAKNIFKKYDAEQ